MFMVMGMSFISCCGCFNVMMVLFAFVVVTTLVTIILLLHSLTILAVWSGTADLRADILMLNT